VGSFSILPIGTYAASANFHQLRDTTGGRSINLPAELRQTKQLAGSALGQVKRGAERRISRLESSGNPWISWGYFSLDLGRHSDRGVNYRSLWH
jgi:hypothetical protein